MKIHVELTSFDSLMGVHATDFFFFLKFCFGTVEVTNERKLRQQLCQHLELLRVHLLLQHLLLEQVQKHSVI